MMCPSDSTHQAHSPMTESSRTRSDSLEASSLQQDRKRPRLDSSHNDSLRSEEALTDSGFPEASPDSDSPNKKSNGATCLSRSSSPATTNMEPSSNGPLSKVTINTRSAANTTSDALDRSADQSKTISVLETSPVTADTAPVDQASGPDMVAIPPDTITIPSSPSQSPEIQIAVVEDIDQDPAETNWTPVTRLTDSVLLQEQARPHYVKRTFPYSQQTPAGFVHEILIEISKIFLQGSTATLIEELHTDLLSRRRARRIHLPSAKGMARQLPRGSSTDYPKTSARGKGLLGRFPRGCEQSLATIVRPTLFASNARLANEG